MDVNDRTALALLQEFSRLEHTLKHQARCFKKGRYGEAMVDWKTFDEAVARLPADRFVERLSGPTRARVLDGERERPSTEVVDESVAPSFVRFRPRPLDPKNNNEGACLVEAARRVRNNLFHGGKQEPDAQEERGNNEAWAEAALEITRLLLGLLHDGTLRPDERAK